MAFGLAVVLLVGFPLAARAAGSNNVTIGTSATSGGTWSATPPLYTFTATSSDATLQNSDLESHLADGSVVIQTGTGTQNGDVMFAASVSSPAEASDLSVSAAGSISQTAPITLAGPAAFRAGGSVTLTDTTNALNDVSVLTTAGNASLTSTSIGFSLGGSTVGGQLSAYDSARISLGTGTIAAAGVSLNGPVTVAGSATVDGVSSPVSFSSTIDGHRDLTVETTATATFDGAVGGTSPLSSLDASGASVSLNGGAVTTTGAQSYGSTTLGADTTATSTGSGAITFGGTVDGAFGLTVASGATKTFDGAVGATTALTSLATQGTGSTSFEGNTVKTTGSQVYGDAVSLGANITLQSTGGGAITLTATVDGARSLAIVTNGTTTFGGAVGSGTALSSVSVLGGTAALNGGTVTTTGNQFYNDNVTLGAGTTLASTGGGGIAVEGTLDGAFSLTVDTGGTTAFNGAVGGTTALRTLTTDRGGTTAIPGGEVLTTGAQTYGDAVTLLANTTLQASVGNITLSGTVDGSHQLTLSASNTVTLDGAVGGTIPLTQITTEGSALILSSGTVDTTGNQTYYSATTLGADATLSSSGGAVDFLADVNGAHGLKVDSNSPTFANDVGNITPLSSLTVAGTGTVSLDAPVSTSGDQRYGEQIVLFANVTLTSTDGTITNTSSTSMGNYMLTVDGAGALDGPLTGSSSLVKQGSGTLVLPATNTVQSFQVTAGTLQVDGNSSSVMTSLTGGSLTGTGQVQLLTASAGALKPGDFPGSGVLTALGATLFQRTTFAPLLGGASAGSGYAQLRVTGNSGSDPDVSLGGSLAPTLATGYAPAVGQVFEVIRNDGTKPVSGVFAGLPEGATLTVGSVPLRVSYVGGDGNDVTLTVAARPTSVAVACSPAAATIGRTATECTATVTDTGPGTATLPTGTVTFHSDSPGSFDSSGACTLSPTTTAGQASCSLAYVPSNVASGTHTISGSYGGDSTHAGASGAGTVAVSSLGPSARILAPSDHGTYTVGQAVPTRFSCQEAPGGPGLSGCNDSNTVGGSADTGTGSTGTGALNTRRAGSFTYTVRATSRDGQVANAVISYTVRAIVRRSAGLRVTRLTARPQTHGCVTELNEGVAARATHCTAGLLTVSGTISRTADGQVVSVTARADIAGHPKVVRGRARARNGRYTLTVRLPGRDTDAASLGRRRTGGDRWAYRVTFAGTPTLLAASHLGRFTLEVESGGH